MTNVPIKRTEFCASEEGVYAEQLARSDRDAEKIAIVARWILCNFDEYYRESRQIPDRARRAFEQRRPPQSLALSKQRLSMYSASINQLGPRVKRVFPAVAEDESLWNVIERQYLPLIEGRYEADLAFAYFLSVRRKIYQGDWKPVEYSFRGPQQAVRHPPDSICRVFPVGGRVTADAIVEILNIPRFETRYRNLREDAELVAERLRQRLDKGNVSSAAPRVIEMVDAGLYRNRGAYLVGRVVLGDETIAPLIIALLNDDRGIYVDAVLCSVADTHNIFSSTLANFHVTNPYYHELSAFLHKLMPTRPVGLHYSTIGYNHVGKVAVMNELKNELSSTKEVFETAVGFRGTVAIGFSSPSSAYNLKVIRDKPTDGYKWGEFAGIESVLHKYRRVHEINRTGSMLDNLIYYNLKLDRRWFDPELLDELLNQSGMSVSLRRDAVVCKYLIVQRRMTPLPVFLETASTADRETVIVNLGYCIKNNAAANIFNKDLDARNYGVSRFLKVYLYDYDALERLTEVKIRTNTDRFDGEEDIPEWYFEDGFVFLPEEIESGLQMRDRGLSRLFRDVHGDLLTVDYWECIQNDLRQGRVPSVRIYPEHHELRRSLP